MDTELTRATKRALMTKAATLEAERQSARERRDWPTAAQAEAELRRLWRAYADLDERVQS